MGCLFPKKELPFPEEARSFYLVNIRYMASRQI